MARRYPALDARFVSDLDLLVAPGWLERLDRRLTGRGFERWIDPRSVGDRYAILYKRGTAGDGCGEALVIDVHPAWHEVRLMDGGRGGVSASSGRGAGGAGSRAVPGERAGAASATCIESGGRSVRCLDPAARDDGAAPGRRPDDGAAGIPGSRSAVPAQQRGTRAGLEAWGAAEAGFRALVGGPWPTEGGGAGAGGVEDRGPVSRLFRGLRWLRGRVLLYPGAGSVALRP